MAKGPYEDKFVRESMMTAKKAFEDAAKTLEGTMGTSKAIVSSMEGGALQGEAGAEFCEAISVDLNKATETLRAKCLELASDIQKAVEAMDKEVSKAKSRFQ
jgi:uncharacterized protein YukE